MKTIKYGATGADVKELQSALNRAGYSLTVDGVFGAKTTTALKDFQSKHGLTVDGIAGPNTWAKLEPYLTVSIIQTINECVADIMALPSFTRFMELIEND